MTHYLRQKQHRELLRLKTENLRGREKRSTFIEHLIVLGLKTYINKKEEFEVKPRKAPVAVLSPMNFRRQSISVLLHAPLLCYLHYDENHEGNDDESYQSYQEAADTECLSPHRNRISRQVHKTRDSQADCRQKQVFDKRLHETAKIDAHDESNCKPQNLVVFDESLEFRPQPLWWWRSRFRLKQLSDFLQFL
jgi:hypothetical protein